MDTNIATRPTPAIDALVQRMLTYDGHFSGYPTLECADEHLIFSAHAENQLLNYCDSIEHRVALEEAPSLAEIPFMTYLASEHVENEDQYRRARDFITDYVDAAWTCNMSEGSNRVHAEVEDAKHSEYALG